VQVIRPPDERLSPPVRGPIIVTGGACGIGFAAARLACVAGADVALVDRDTDALERAAEALRDNRGRVMRLACDVSDEEQVRQAFARSATGLGAAAGLIASAGIDEGSELHELDSQTWDRVLAVNLRGIFLACREALRQMLGVGRGAIVCLSSPFAVAAAPGGTGAYSASKGGISALVRSLAVDYAARGIRVNAVLPGPTETDLMWANVSAEDVPGVRDTISTEVPLGRMADPTEPARAALWLLSDEASFVTGAGVACDGGVLAKSSVSV
jgi:NAD(P)-dependent dehydrogenase (short-subunit alcohol dehydrogenase family)